MSGAWTNEILRQLTVGTSGAARIDIGPTDTIKVYNASNILIAEISGAGFQTFDPLSAGHTSTLTNGRLDLSPGNDAGVDTFQSLDLHTGFLGGPIPFGQLDGPGKNGGYGGRLTLVAADAATATPATGTLDSDNLTISANLLTLVGAVSSIQLTGAGASPTFTVGFGQAARVLTSFQAGLASASLTLTGVTTDVPGCTVTYTPQSTGALWIALAIADTSIAAAGGLAVGGLNFTGGAAGGQLVASGAAGTRATIAQLFIGTLPTVVSYTWKLQGTSGGGVGNSFASNNTRLFVAVFE